MCNIDGVKRLHQPQMTVPHTKPSPRDLHPTKTLTGIPLEPYISTDSNAALTGDASRKGSTFRHLGLFFDMEASLHNSHPREFQEPASHLACKHLPLRSHNTAPTELVNSRSACSMLSALYFDPSDPGRPSDQRNCSSLSSLNPTAPSWNSITTFTVSA